MTDPTAWGEALSEVVWAYWLAQATYNAATVATVVIGVVAGLCGALWLLRWMHRVLP